MKINFILTGEGSSDLRLVEHIENLLVDEGFTEVSGEAPDLGMFRNPVGRTVHDKLVALLRYYPHVDIIFVHRDADNVGIAAREQEIMEAAQHIIEADRVIPLIPVTMLETWLLADIDAIKRVAGNNQYPGKFVCIPAIRQLESVRDTKKILLDALCEASQTQGTRLKKFKGRFSEMRARLAYELDPNGPVKNLNSYCYFRNKIRTLSENRLQENE